jgi:hypothetical protein
MPDHFRLGFGVTEKGFADGLQRIADHLTTPADKAVSTTV